MIFVTVGTDLPFDRLVQAVNCWAKENARSDVFAQTGRSGSKPDFIESAEFLEPTEFTKRFKRADLIVGHAGMGTILSALRFGKPALVMPRRADLGEQRNDHQMATARRLAALGKVNVAFDEAELIRCLDNLPTIAVRDRTGAFADEKLQASIRDFIWNGEFHDTHTVR